MADKDPQNLRKKPRIERHFMIRYQPQENPTVHNQGVSTIQNISETGCFFYSACHYKIGEKLDVEIRFPLIAEPAKFVAEVKRCIEEDPKIPKYAIGILFIDVDQEKKDAFIKTLDFFLKKRSGNK
ncbi:MAG: hypothetical protein DRP74_01455 [Candidatus Omnitrophota bacterium]|nr:MAG: hypothetical protein DRP74_01455 [Candidatus Omnitrophota bacterium]